MGRREQDLKEFEKRARSVLLEKRRNLWTYPASRGSRGGSGRGPSTRCPWWPLPRNRQKGPPRTKPPSLGRVPPIYFLNEKVGNSVSVEKNNLTDVLPCVREWSSLRLGPARPGWRRQSPEWPQGCSRGGSSTWRDLDRFSEFENECGRAISVSFQLLSDVTHGDHRLHPHREGLLVQLQYVVQRDRNLNGHFSRSGIVCENS